MEPQEQGFSEPNLSPGQPNFGAGWQPPVEQSEQSTHPPQQATSAQSLTGNNGVQSQPGIASSAPAQASDSDLVEKEWVEAAKKIMDTFRSDPYNKNRSLTLLRADYLKKRYNKDVKIPEN